MKLTKLFALAAVCGAVSMSCAHTPEQREPIPAVALQATRTPYSEPAAVRMDAKWVSAIMGMRVETSTGTSLGRVQEVVVDGYGRPAFAIVTYGGIAGLGAKHTAVPWATVANMLDRDRLVMDRTNLENAPLLASAVTGSRSRDWRREAESYWNGKVAVAQ